MGVLVLLTDSYRSLILSSTAKVVVKLKNNYSSSATSVDGSNNHRLLWFLRRQMFVLSAEPATSYLWALMCIISRRLRGDVSNDLHNRSLSLRLHIESRDFWWESLLSLDAITGTIADSRDLLYINFSSGWPLALCAHFYQFNHTCKRMDEKDSKSISSDKDTKESKKESSTPSPFQLHLDTGEEYVRFRQKFWQIWCVWYFSSPR